MQCGIFASFVNQPLKLKMLLFCKLHFRIYFYSWQEKKRRSYHGSPGSVGRDGRESRRKVECDGREKNEGGG